MEEEFKFKIFGERIIFNNQVPEIIIHGRDLYFAEKPFAQSLLKCNEFLTDTLNQFPECRNNLAEINFSEIKTSIVNHSKIDHITENHLGTVNNRLLKIKADYIRIFNWNTLFALYCTADPQVLCNSIDYIGQKGIKLQSTGGAIIGYDEIKFRVKAMKYKEKIYMPNLTHGLLYKFKL